MDVTPVRDLRHRSAVEQPWPRHPLAVEQLIARRASLPRVNAGELRADHDEVLDPRLCAVITGA